jgi:hypothetical protein
MRQADLGMFPSLHAHVLFAAKINSDKVWLLVFTAQSQDESKLKGVDQDKCRQIEARYRHAPAAVAVCLLYLDKSGLVLGVIGPAVQQQGMRQCCCHPARTLRVKTQICIFAQNFMCTCCLRV